MAKFVPLSEAELNNDTSWYTSVGAGLASGLIKTVEGVVSLGAELVDLGADSNTAASVEQFFDDINIFEDTAQDRVVGKLTEVFTQIGIPGGVGFKRNPPVYMKVGDHVEVEISEIGVLSNKVEDEIS